MLEMERLNGLWNWYSMELWVVARVHHTFLIQEELRIGLWITVTRVDCFEVVLMLVKIVYLLGNCPRLSLQLVLSHQGNTAMVTRLTILATH